MIGCSFTSVTSSISVFLSRLEKFLGNLLHHFPMFSGSTINTSSSLNKTNLPSTAAIIPNNKPGLLNDIGEGENLSTLFDMELARVTYRVVDGCCDSFWARALFINLIDVCI